MVSPENPDSAAIPSPRLLVMQIIVAALVVGLFVMIAIAGVISWGQIGPNGARPPAPVFFSLPTITLVLFLFAVIYTPLFVVVPAIVLRNGRKNLLGKAPDGDVEGLLNVYQTKLIVVAAMREGLGQFAAVAYLIEHQVIALGLALVCVVGVAMLFPTRTRVEQWLDAQLALLSQERELGS